MSSSSDAISRRGATTLPTDGNGGSRATRCRHSGRRATEFRKARQQLAFVGLQGSRGNKEQRYTTYTKIKELVTSRRSKLQSGISTEDVATWMVDDTETRLATPILNPDFARLENQQPTKWTHRGQCPTLGNLTTTRRDGTFRLMNFQINSMSSRLVRNAKVEQITWLADHYDVDMILMQEVGVNGGHYPPSQNLASFFQTAVYLRSVTAHNQNENPKTPHQQGGTGIIAFNTILQYIFDHPAKPLGA